MFVLIDQVDGDKFYSKFDPSLKSVGFYLVGTVNFCVKCQENVIYIAQTNNKIYLMTLKRQSYHKIKTD